MSKKKKIIYISIGLIIIGAIIFILCSHFILNKKVEEFNGFTFKEVTKLNYGDIILSDFVKDITCEEECTYHGQTLEYSISNIEDLGKVEVLVSITYQGNTYEQSYEVEVVDELAPIITLTETEMNYVKNSDAIFASEDFIKEVSDNYDEVAVEDVSIESNVNLKKVGDYQITYTLTDTHNNVGTSILIVHVVDEEAKENSDDKKETNSTNNKTNNTTTNNKNNSSKPSSNFKSTINSVSLSPLKTRYPDLDSEIASIISSVTNSGMSNYEKLQAIYNYVKNKLNYSTPLLNNRDIEGLQETYNFYYTDALQIYNAYFALYTGYGVCDNYAALFMILARRIGFDAYVVGGKVNKVGGGTTSHAWVMIKAGGTYYIFDPQIEDSKKTSYDYFGKTDTELPIYHYTLSSNISKFYYFKENPKQPHTFSATFKVDLEDYDEVTIKDHNSSYTSSTYEKGKTINITFSTSLKQDYKIEILKNDEVISSESYDGSSKTITLTFDEVGPISYDIKIKTTGNHYVMYGIHGTVKEPAITNTPNEA